MSARVSIELPDASREDACAFGLWLDMLLRDSTTRIGEIRVEVP